MSWSADTAGGRASEPLQDLFHFHAARSLDQDNVPGPGVLDQKRCALRRRLRLEYPAARQTRLHSAFGDVPAERPHADQETDAPSGNGPADLTVRFRPRVAELQHVAQDCDGTIPS